jgi:hypothetical protein
VTGGWRRQEFHNLYASQNIISVIKLMRMGWAEHVTCMRQMRNASSV